MALNYSHGKILCTGENIITERLAGSFNGLELLGCRRHHYSHGKILCTGENIITERLAGSFNGLELLGCRRHHYQYLFFLFLFVIPLSMSLFAVPR
jgi:hypothetical protein